MPHIPADQRPKPVMPVGREAVLHSEITDYHPAPEERPEVDRQATSVPSAKKYLIWFLIALALFVVFLVLLFTK